MKTEASPVELADVAELVDVATPIDSEEAEVNSVVETAKDVVSGLSGIGLPPPLSDCPENSGRPSSIPTIAATATIPSPIAFFKKPRRTDGTAAVELPE
jgi:hypothetical protein